MSQNQLINQTINDIFCKSASSSPRHLNTKQGERKISKEKLEIALAVILVDLASCDQNFDNHEYHAICEGMRRVLGTSKTEVGALVQRAQIAIANLRGTSNFATLLRDNLSDDARSSIWEVIEELISADGVQDGFELYLRNKYAELLGIELATARKASPQ